MRFAAKTDLALGLHHAAQSAQGRRLPCAFRPEQGRDRLFLHCKADPVDHPRGAVAAWSPDTSSSITPQVGPNQLGMLPHLVRRAFGDAAPKLSATTQSEMLITRLTVARRAGW